MTISLLLTLLLTAPPVADAEALAVKRDAETLFLQFGSANPADYDEAERVRLAAALLKGARAAQKDVFIALPLLQRAVALHRTAEALTLLGQTELELDQRSQASGHFDEALVLEPANKVALLARADLAERENEPQLAVALYQRAVAAGARGDVKARLAKATLAHQEHASAVRTLKATEVEIEAKIKEAAKSATSDWISQIRLEDDADTERRIMAPGGVRKQEAGHFIFTYLVGKTPPSELREFERTLVKLLEKTHDFVSGKLNHKKQKQTPVVLMSRAEFAAKYAGTPMGNAAGFWDGTQIVINGGTAITESFAGTMVHEFTHAMVTDIAGHGSVPRWANEGLAENLRLCAQGTDGELEPHYRRLLTQAKAAKSLPMLEQTDSLFQAMGPDVSVSYGLSGLAVKLLLKKRDYPSYVELLRAFRHGKRPDSVLGDHFSTSLKALNEEIHAELSR